MSALKNVHWKKLDERAERMVARMEAKARGDTIHGGMSAQVLADKLLLMGGTDLRHVVNAVYALSSGKPHAEYAAFECPECGAACLGKDGAENCCSHMRSGMDDDWMDDIDKKEDERPQ